MHLLAACCFVCFHNRELFSSGHSSHELPSDVPAISENEVDTLSTDKHFKVHQRVPYWSGRLRIDYAVCVIPALILKSLHKIIQQPALFV